ncbi:MAG TPA: hypothetical protein VKM55_11795 [Candidatus Lokiarchaeia archaeon]|nr:hypothetical protein [Candidatus Lokiarchaeia archaeon]
MMTERGNYINFVLRARGLDYKMTGKTSPNAPISSQTMNGAFFTSMIDRIEATVQKYRFSLSA